MLVCESMCVYWWLCEWVFVYCICQWTATCHSSLLLLSFFFFSFLQKQAAPCIGKYTVLFITIVTFYNVFFYHILYVRNNIKSHFQIWTVCLITKIDMRDIFFPWWWYSIGDGKWKTPFDEQYYLVSASLSASFKVVIICWGVWFVIVALPLCLLM